ncbi:MAG: penicillin-insensitive murein endopeptidase [Gammaproteobacteria bacterium]|jgi:penicillin-insensitive murein endopeptidase|nr:penicillin-insensitive murein endopeptidase [Gammaproteobacteria bacterium]
MRRFALIAISLFAPSAAASESVCYGTTANGRLEGGVQLPSSGDNFLSYGPIPERAGRTYVHSKVRDVVVTAYKILEQEEPRKLFKYAETGFKEGGEFGPHKTHRNGLSVDFMVPVVDADGRSVPIRTDPFNRYGYGIEFDEKGVYDDYRIDFDAMSAHLRALDIAAKRQGIGIWRVLFDPGLQPYLHKSKYGSYVKQNIEIPKRRSWVRHDEHYHVDFSVECRPM